MKKNVWWLGLVSFINDTSSKLILPILPLFIKEIGGAGLALGLISGLGESISSFFKMLAGYWSDKLGRRKPFVFTGYLISSISKLLFSFSQNWPQVLGLRSAERFGKGLRSASRDAILAASSKRRGRVFGIHRALDSGGSVLGGILAFLFFWFLGLSFRRIFLIAGIIAFLSLIPIFFVREKGTKKKAMNLRIGFSRLSKRLRVFIIIATIFALGNFSYMFFVLRSQDYFSEKLAIGIPILLYVLYNISYTAFAIPAGNLADKIGKKKVLLAGYSLFGLVCMGFLFAGSLVWFVILFLLFGLNYALVNATERAYVSDLAAKSYRGTALGTFHMAVSLAALPAGLIAGKLWDLSSSYAFIYGAALSLAAIAAFIVFDD